ncbi:MAG TPA: acyl-homoserine-lactone synthase [Rhizomicrobium sp.]|nr:acyl-homoserine-lactone synthase [Rhizomicrobium sp.]
MVAVITSNNRAKYREQLNQMHRDRKKVFVDRWKWSVPVVDGQYEIDQFDTDDAVYLLGLDRLTHTHLSSVRLLPTTRPYLLGSLFDELCEEAPPESDDTWEITRYCEAPEWPKPSARAAGDKISIALVEFALLHGISRYVCVTHAAMLSQVLAEGWECEPLGLPKEINGESLMAIAMKVSTATLQLLRQRYGERYPVIELEARAEAA